MIKWNVMMILSLTLLGIVYQIHEGYEEHCEQTVDPYKLESLKFYRNKQLYRFVFVIGVALINCITKEYVANLVFIVSALTVLAVLYLIAFEIGCIETRSEALTYLSVLSVVGSDEMLSIFFAFQFFIVYWLKKRRNDYSEKYVLQCRIYLILSFINILLQTFEFNIWYSFFIILMQICILPMLVSLGSKLYYWRKS